MCVDAWPNCGCCVTQLLDTLTRVHWWISAVDDVDELLRM